jgi:tetratricopeptide (TPR) repeat protein
MRSGHVTLPLILLACLSAWRSPLQAAQPQAIYILDFDTNIAGENRSVAQDLSSAIETAFSRRRSAFRLLERRALNDIVSQGKMEKDLQALTRGEKPSAKFIDQLRGADGVLRGELKETRLDGVVLTVSLTRLDSEKIWQAQRKHSLYEWLSSEVRDREAEALAADAEAALLPAARALPEIEDGPRGLALANSGKCSDALPLLENAAAVDGTNAEYYMAIGRCQYQGGFFADASRAFTSAIARNPRRTDTYVERARSFLAQSLSSRAVEDLDQALKLDPNNLSAVELRGDVVMKAGKYDAAVDAYYAVYQQRPSRAVCQKLADAYQKNGASSAAATLQRTCPTLP